MDEIGQKLKINLNSQNNDSEKDLFEKFGANLNKLKKFV